MKGAIAQGPAASRVRQRARYAKGYYLVYPEESAQMQSLQIFRAWLLAQAGDAT